MFRDEAIPSGRRALVGWRGCSIAELRSKNALAAFNAEASRKDSKWKHAKTADDLGRMKEHDFLDTLESISILGKKVKQELQKCLQLRNGCGHPNSLQIADHKVSAHIEDLILNVFAKFS